MPFDASSGPPASQKQLEYLEDLLRKAGYADYREARGPLGLTQRQGRGKFTKREASELISQLLETEEPASEDEPIDTADSPSRDEEPPRPAPPDRRAAASPPSAGSTNAPDAAASLAAVPDVVLVAELRRRGWTVVLPD